MNPVQKALWYVENHLREPVSLDHIAEICEVSAYHLTRAFGASMGISLMRYVRGRRLSEAARKLAAGANDILNLALDAGYGSHEAFTRAFREQFALTPEQVRAQGHLDNLKLMEPILMSSVPTTDLAPPRFENLKTAKLAGLSARYNCDAATGIPGQWQQFSPWFGRIPNQIGRASYGVSSNFDSDANEFDYLCGVEVKDSASIPAGLTSIALPAGPYAVFWHGGHVSGIRSTIAAIFNTWLPSSGYQAAQAPMAEKYDERFDPRTGNGGFEIWLPVQGK